MGDIAVENYQKSVSKILDLWAKEADRIGKELTAVNTELDKLEALQNPGPDDKKRIEELKKKREACHKRMNEASMELRVNLMVIELPAKADEKELLKLPTWLKEIIKKKGIPLGKVVITPDVEFDFKGKKLKKLGITIKW
jgi:seryl-tRNA synthetase